jgi:hypothetical protein
MDLGTYVWNGHHPKMKYDMRVNVAFQVPFTIHGVLVCGGNYGFESTGAVIVLALFFWLIQPAVLFSQNKLVTSNQPAVFFSQNKSAAAKRTGRLFGGCCGDLKSIGRSSNLDSAVTGAVSLRFTFGR